MFNATLHDNQQAVIHSGPKTASGLSNPTFVTSTFQILGNDNNAALAISVIPGTFDFLAKPRAAFFGPDKVATITFQAAKTSTGPNIQGVLTVTIQGSLPDDGTLDHFEPSSEAPTPQ